MYCVCALIFHRDAIKNARYKLTGRISRGMAATLASVTADDLAAAASEVDGGTGAWAALSDRDGVRALIKTMVSVHSRESWTIYNKRSTRVVVISFIIQMGQNRCFGSLFRLPTSTAPLS